MNRTCIVDLVAGLVVNVVEYDELFVGTPPGMEDRFRAVPSGVAQIGWTFDGAGLHAAALPDARFYDVVDNGDGTTTVVPKDLAVLRLAAIADVKRLRQSALDTFPKSPGVSEVYAENLRAAQAVTAGDGVTTIMRDGSTAEAYLGAMAAGMGISAAQFAAYVLAENTAAAVKAREIEAEYVRLAYTFIPGCSFDQVQLLADDFRDFCAARTAA